jgi:hypothetical protein
MEYPKQSFTPQKADCSNGTTALYLKVTYFDEHDRCDKILTVPFDRYLADGIQDKSK